MIVEISISVIAFAFLVLVIYLAITLIALKKSLKNVDLLLTKFNNLAINIQEKAETLDPLFYSISNLGESLEEATKSLSSTPPPSHNGSSVYLREKKLNQISKIADWVELAALGILLCQKIKKGVR